MGFDAEIIKRGGTYLSCEELRAGIHFSKDRIYYCCKRDVINGDSNPYSYDLPILFDGIDENTVYDDKFFNKLYDNKIDFITKINEGHECECSNCAYLEERNWEPMPNLFVNLHIGADYICNANCSYCEQDHAAKSKYNLYEFIKNMVDLGYFDVNNENNYASFGGGEPTLMRNFDEIVDKIGKVGRRHFLTTCITFNERIAQYMETATTGGLFFSIDAGTRETFKKVKGVDQFDKSIANFKKYYDRTKYKNRITLKYIVMEENCSEEEIDAFLKMIEDNGLYGISIIINRNFYVDVTDKVRAGIYYLALRVPLVARCRPYFGVNAPRQLVGINEKLRMNETFYHRLLIHKIEEKGLDIQDIIQYVREL